MTKNNLDELLNTLEEIRSLKYPDVPADVISMIIDIQYKYQDNPAKRQSETQRIITNYANQIKSSEGEKVWDSKE